MQKQSFNKNWVVKHRLSSIMSSVWGAQCKEENVSLPHDAMITMERAADAPSGVDMAFFKGENIVYVKEFVIPAEEKDKVHYLYFDGVYMNPTFFINGAFVQKFRYGYTPCCMRIDRYLRYDAPNTLQVAIRGTNLPNSRWYSGQGIYRDAWILTGDYLHVAPDGLHVTTLDCDRELAVLEVKAELQNEGQRSREGYVKLTVHDGSGREVAGRKARFYVDSNGRVTVRQRIHLEKPALWNVDTPNLYSVDCQVIDRETEQTVDTAQASFGVRKLQLDSVHGLRINGQSVKLKGGCVHHDNGLLGAVSVDDAEARRVLLHKNMGYNALRTAHNPPSAALLNACDKYGMLVMHEFTDIWTQNKAAFDYSEYFPESWEADVEAVVRRDYNHPSIIFWSIGNEIPETGETLGAQWGRKLAEKFRSLDHTRFITNGINVMVSCIPYFKQIMENQAKNGVNDIIGTSGGAADMMSMITSSPMLDPYVEESCDLLDVIGYNYSNERYEREHPLHPEWIFFGSETFSGALDKNWDTVKRNSYVLGDFCWTSMDYLGEVGCGRIAPKDQDSGAFMGDYPWLASADGDFDLTGFRRPMSYWREIIWGGREHVPYIAVHRMQNFGKELYISRWNFTDAINSWTWPGYEGKPTTVEVYSDAEEVELFLNGASLGRKKVGNDFHQFYCCWDVAYAPGTLLAVAYIGGREAGRYELSTAGTPRLSVRADKRILRAGSNDLSYVEIELRDENGILYMASDRTATVRVDGTAVLAGCGSANPCTEERYDSLTHRFFEGRILAILRAGEQAGKTSLTVSADGMKSVTVEVETV